MTQRWCEGFEVRQNTTALQQAYTAVSGTLAFVSGRLHGTALQGPDSDTAALRKDFDNQATWVVGLAFIKEDASSTFEQLIKWEDSSANTQMQVRTVNSGGSMELQVVQGASTVLTTTSLTLAYGTWYYLEFKCTFNGTTGSYELRINGATAASGTGANTAPSGNNHAARLTLYMANINGTQAVAIDDCYVLDGTGGSLDDFLGDGTTEGIFPTAAGNSQQWSPQTNNHLLVDDASGPDNDGTYIHTAGTGIKDTYTFGNLGFITGNIQFIQVIHNSRVASAGSRTLRPIIRHGGTDYAGSNQTVDSTSYSEKSQLFAQNPGTAAAWTVSDINGAEFGIEAVA